MLVISVYEKDRVQITVGDVIFYIKTVEIRGKRVRLGFDAPKSVKVLREELVNK